LVKPFDVVGVVRVEFAVWVSSVLKGLTFEDFGPFQDARPFDAVFGESGGVGNGADGEGGRGGEGFDTALVAGGNGRKHDTGLTLEA
jgi:hypothetical protein